jgi:hypothetical protein
VLAIAVGYRSGLHPGDGFRAGNTRRVDRLHVHDALLERGLEFGPNERTHRRISDGILAAAAVSSVFSHYEIPTLDGQNPTLQ